MNQTEMRIIYELNRQTKPDNEMRQGEATYVKMVATHCLSLYISSSIDKMRFAPLIQ